MTNTAKIIITLKGGPGSGHHGHGGLPGVHGGSRPGSGGKASASNLGKQQFMHWGRGSAAVWMTGRGKDTKGVAVSYRDGYQTYEITGAYSDMPATYHDYKTGGHKKHDSEDSAKRYLSEEYGVDWDGRMRRDDKPRVEGTPAQRMAAQQVSQAVSRGQLTEAQARQKLGR